MSYINPTPGQLPIIGVGNLEGDTYYGKAILSSFRECGINIAQFQIPDTQPRALETMGGTIVSPPILSFQGVTDKSDIFLFNNTWYSLDNGRVEKIRIMVRYAVPEKRVAIPGPEGSVPSYEKVPDWDRWQARWIEAASLFRNAVAFGGWMLGNQPTRDQFPEIRKASQALASNSPYLRFVNLLPCWAFQKNLTNYVAMTPEEMFTYLDYLYEFEEACDPQVGATSMYAFRENPDVVNHIYLEKDYFNQLYIGWRNSVNVDIPFWANIRVMTHSYPENGDFSKSILSLEKFRFQAYTALAFGAQGLICWSMVERISDNASENYYGAPLTANCLRTPAFENLKSVLTEVRRYEQVFLGCKVLDIVYGSLPAGLMTDGLDCLNTFAAPIGSISALVYPGNSRSDKDEVPRPPVLVSHLENNGRQYTVVVNLNWDSNENVRIIFSEAVKNLTSQSDQILQAGSVKDYILAPSDWLIFEKVS